MKFYLSLEDKSASVDNTGEYSEYRRAIVEFLKSQIEEGDSVIEDAGGIGWTSFPEDDVEPNMARVARGTEYEIVLRKSMLKQINTPFKPPWRLTTPVLVIDSDGLDPEFILDYIGLVVSHERTIRNDSIQLGHLERWLGYFSKPGNSYVGTFGIIVQHPNLEGGSFASYREENDKLMELGSRHTNLAYIEKTPQKDDPFSSPYSPGPRPRTITHLGKEFLEANATGLFSEMVSERAIFIPDPEGWVNEVRMFRKNRVPDMSSSFYLSKKDRVSKKRRARGLKSVIEEKTLDPYQLEFTFRLFQSPIS